MDFLFNFLDYIKINIEYNYLKIFLFFFIFLIIYNSFSIPGNMVFIAATGYFFGSYIGYLLSISTLVLGSLIFFSFSNFFIGKIFLKYLNKYTSNLDKFIAGSSIEYLIIFRMIPGPPLFFQNLILSFLKIKKIDFILSSFIGFTPYVFMLVFIGNQFNNIDKLINLSFGDIFTFKFLFFICCIILLIVIRIFYKKK